jgi:high-affinity iron transporter
LAAVVLGWLLARGMLRLNLRRFFLWTGAFLIIVAAGVLAYAVHDLQEGGVLPGPFGALAPTDPVSGAVAIGLAGWPFGWAFDVTAQIAPGSPLAAVLQAAFGFMPQMTWLQVIAWTLYVVIVGAFFLRGAQRGRMAAASPAKAAPVVVAASSVDSVPEPVRAMPADTPSLPQGAA